MTLLREPPLYESRDTLDQIIGANLPLYKRFLTVYFTKYRDYEETLKKFKNEEIQIIAKVNAQLSDNGYIPMGINASGEIRWAVTTSFNKMRIKPPHRESTEQTDQETAKKRINQIMAKLRHNRLKHRG